jgi:hypothetical protein
MIFAGFFAGALCLALILGDWLYFVRLTPDASRYGCGVARTHDRYTHTTMKQLADRFVAAWNRAILPGSEPDCHSPEIPAVRHRLPNIVAVERVDLPVSGRRRTRGALPKAHSLVLGSSHRYLVCSGGRGYGGGPDLLVHRGRNGGTRWSGVGVRDCRVGTCFFSVRSHYSCVCLSARECPAYDGVSRTPGGARRNKIAVLRRAWSIWFVWLIWFIWLVSFNQTNQTNQMNQMNKI